LRGGLARWIYPVFAIPILIDNIIIDQKMGETLVLLNAHLEFVPLLTPKIEPGA
tara:strand:+ start:171 stop:332 length:162 start_codon:yes stop_codon:yes gene_type:complete